MSIIERVKLANLILMFFIGFNYWQRRQQKIKIKCTRRSSELIEGCRSGKRGRKGFTFLEPQTMWPVNQSESHVIERGRASRREKGPPPPRGVMVMKEAEPRITWRVQLFQLAYFALLQLPLNKSTHLWTYAIISIVYTHHFHSELLELILFVRRRMKWVAKAKVMNIMNAHLVNELLHKVGVNGR